MHEIPGPICQNVQPEVITTTILSLVLTIISSDSQRLGHFERLKNAK